MIKVLTVLICLLLVTPLYAETIHLTDGRTVAGSITAKKAKSVQVDVNGVSMTYFADEIKDIDGVPFAAPAAATAAPVSSAAEGVGKRDLVLKFIEVFGTRAAMSQNLEAMMGTLPEGPEKQKLVKVIKVDEIIDRLVPLYEKKFSEAELTSYIEFYSSAQGRKLVSSIAEIMRESVAVSTQYFQEKFPELKSEEKK